MPIIANTTGLVRFRVVGDKEAVALAITEMRERLAHVAFRPIDDSPGEERSFGFTRFSDPLDVDFEKSNPVNEPYVFWKLRLDERKISPAGLLTSEFNKYLRKEQEQRQAQIKEEGLVPVSRDRKKEIREQCRLRLISRIPPMMEVADVAWNFSTGIVYLTQTKNGYREMLQGLFSMAFPGLTLEEITNVNVLGSDAQSMTDGSDFLTWLYRRPSSFKEADGTDFLAYVGDSLTVQGDKESITANGNRDMEGVKLEIKEEGKDIIKAKVVIKQDADEWSFVVKGCNFEMSSFKTPSVSLKVDDDEGFAGVALEKMYLIEKALELFKRVYLKYAINSGAINPDLVKLAEKAVEVMGSEEGAVGLVDFVKNGGAKALLPNLEETLNKDLKVKGYECSIEYIPHEDTEAQQ